MDVTRISPRKSKSPQLMQIKNDHLVTPASQTGDFCEQFYLRILNNGLSFIWSSNNLCMPNVA